MKLLVAVVLQFAAAAVEPFPPPMDSKGEMNNNILAGGWIPFAIAILLSIVFAWTYVRYYQHRREREAGPTVISILALVVTLLTTALIPVDIFLVSSFKSTDGTFNDWASSDIRHTILSAITNAYYGMYGTICVFAFFLMPMAYFFFEEKDEIAGVTTSQRMCSAMKFTCGTLIVLAALMCIGAFALNSDGTECADTDANCKLNFAENSLAKNGGTNALSFTVAVLAVVGMLYFVMYTGSGMAILPISLIRSDRTPPVIVIKERVEQRVGSTRSKQESLRAKYAGKSKNMSDRDRDRLADEEDEERALLSAEKDLLQNEKSWVNKVAKCCRPFTAVIGVFLLLVSLFVGICLLLTSVDRLLQIEKQGLNFKTGYSEAAPSLMNPFDKFMDILEMVFPLDYIVISALVLYLILGTASSITCHGIRFCFMKVFRVRANGTAPQGLLCLISILMFTILAINIVLLSLTPQYSTYGNQKYTLISDPSQEEYTTWPSSNTALCDSTAPNYIYVAYNKTGSWQLATDWTNYNPNTTTHAWECKPGVLKSNITHHVLDLSTTFCARLDSCVATRFSALLHAFFYNAWFFGAIYYWANWGFVGVFFISTIYYFVKKPTDLLAERINEHKNNFDDDEDVRPFNPSWLKK